MNAQEHASGMALGNTDSSPGGTSDSLTDSSVATVMERVPNEPVYHFSSGLAVLANPGGVIAESVGALRNHILAGHIRDGRRSLAVCGPSAGAGCSFVATNLAVATAQAGIKTLLVDANLRNPSLEEYIQTSRQSPGLLQCLSDSNVSLRDAIRSDVLPQLSLLYSGGTADSSQELLAGVEFKALIEDCMRDFDLTIVDTTPTNVSADSRRIASVLRYALMVARRDQSYVSDVRKLAEELQSDRVTVIGTFLNDI